MPSCGQILYYRDYVFSDNTTGNKLFVVMNDSADLTTPCLVLKTTSQSRRYEGSSKGCNLDKKCFFTTCDWQKCFDSDTYIQLPQIIPIPASELIKEGLANKIDYLGSLTPDCFAQLKGCLRRFKDDIVDSHWKLIFH